MSPFVIFAINILTKLCSYEEINTLLSENSNVRQNNEQFVVLGKYIHVPQTISDL